MRLYAQSGQRNAALRQYRECVRILEAELAVAPLQETTSLYESIRENRLGEEPKGAAFAPASAEARSPETSIVHPFVGRVKEWQVLSRLLGARETCQWIVIEGEAGIGKTRLAEEFTQRAARMGACTITARCYEGEADLAYGAYIQALRTALGSDRQISKLSSLPLHFQQEVSRILPELTVLGVESPPPTPLDSPGAQVRFFESLSQAVLAILNEGDTPGILFIDDAQWLDKASVELTIYLARRLHEHCLTLLLTWRTEDVDESHPLRRVLGEALRKGQGAHLKLSRLDHDAVREWVRAETKQYGELSERIFRESEGLPFFVVEYLGALSDAGRMDSFSEWSLPRGMRDLIHSRVAMLSETDKQVLTCAAVIGRSFDLDTLHKASGRNEEETVDALEHLLARGLIRETPSAGSPQPQYDFAHDKVRAVVYDEASLARRRLLHGRVAEALAQRTRTLPAKAQIASLVAHHYQLAGQETLAAEYFERAGLYARELFANTEAIAGYRAALAIGHPEPARLHEALGDLLTLNADYDAALKSYENAAALLKASNLAWLEHKLGNVHARRGDWELAELHYQTARNGLGDSALTELARLEADRSFAAHARGDDAQALLFGGQALEFAQNAKDSRALAQAQNLMGILARRAGDDKQACEFLEASLKTANELNDPSIKTAALNNLALVYREEGDLTRARELTETALSLCAALGDRHREAALRSNLSDLLYAMGDQEKAMEQLKSAVVIFAEIGHKSEELQPEIWKLVEW
jgi:predicted ATPase